MGTVEKEAVHIVKNAHALTSDLKNYEQNDNGKTFNGHLGRYLTQIYPLLSVFFIPCIIRRMDNLEKIDRSVIDI